MRQYRNSNAVIMLNFMLVNDARILPILSAYISESESRDSANENDQLLWNGE